MSYFSRCVLVVHVRRWKGSLLEASRYVLGTADGAEESREVEGEGAASPDLCTAQTYRSHHLGSGACVSGSRVLRTKDRDQL